VLSLAIVALAAPSTQPRQVDDTATPESASFPSPLSLA